MARNGPTKATLFSVSFRICLYQTFELIEVFILPNFKFLPWKLFDGNFQREVFRRKSFDGNFSKNFLMFWKILTFNLLTIASFRIGVPSILFWQKVDFNEIQRLITKMYFVKILSRCPLRKNMECQVCGFYIKYCITYTNQNTMCFFNALKKHIVF